MNEEELTLTLTVAETNTILRCLAKHPFEESANIIRKIRLQGDPQVKTEDKNAD